MNVYPSRRSFYQARRFYKGSTRSATSIKALGPRGLALRSISPGVWFPIPKSSWKVMVKTFNALNKRAATIVIATIIAFIGPPDTYASVSTEEAKALGLTGTELTPFGAERAGNAAGTIPPWTGGITEIPPGFEPGKAYPDPYADDVPLFKITAQNYKAYAANLSPTQIEMFKRYPESFWMNVYPSRRSFSQPLRFYEGSIRNATNIKVLGPRGLDLSSISPGVWFPIPKSGWEVMVNKTYPNFGGHHIHGFSTVVTNADGTYVSNKTLEYSMLLPFMDNSERPTGEPFDSAMWCRAGLTLSPPKDAGQAFTSCSRVENFDFDSYLYLPGQRRVRRAPELATYDAPYQPADGLMTTDHYNGYNLNGIEERYDYKIMGKSEMYIPYNNYKIMQPSITLDDVIQKNHINPDLVRYELHRVWNIEATLLPGFRHLLPKRVLHIDEDTWTGAEGEHYDENGKLWRIGESLIVFYYDNQSVRFWGDTVYDLKASRYVVNLISNDWSDHRYPDFKTVPDLDWFTPQGLRRKGMR